MKVTIIGTGYVGLVTGACLADMGNEVLCVDVDHGKVERLLRFGPDYAETLRRWRASFMAEGERVSRLGFDTRFVRIWEFYLAYCEAAFDTSNTDVVQFTLHKP